MQSNFKISSNEIQLFLIKNLFISNVTRYTGPSESGCHAEEVNSRLPWAQNINGDPCNINLIWPWLYLVKDVPIGLGFGL